MCGTCRFAGRSKCLRTYHNLILSTAPASAPYKVPSHFFLAQFLPSFRPARSHPTLSADTRNSPLQSVRPVLFELSKPVFNSRSTPMSHAHSRHPITSVSALTHPPAEPCRPYVQTMAQPVSLYYDSQPQLLPPPHRRLPQLSARPRSYNGRFLPETDFNRKVCGWCNTQTTSQWRVGCTTGSEAMKTLCNACGINYRRTQRKVPNLVLDLDVLAQNHSKRLSILKEFKRQRKLSPALDRFKTKPRKLIHRARPRSSNLNMLLSDSAPLLSRQPPAAPMHTLTTLIPPASVPTRRTFTSTCFPLVPAQPLSSLVPHSPHTRYRLPSFKEVTRNLSQMNL